jgi:hypothetical protein
MVGLSNHSWREWRPDREPTDGELLAMTGEEFLSYADAIERYARYRKKEDFSWHYRPSTPAATADKE